MEKYMDEVDLGGLCTLWFLLGILISFFFHVMCRGIKKLRDAGF
jgi:hypothetical protein